MVVGGDLPTSRRTAPYALPDARIDPIAISARSRVRRLVVGLLGPVISVGAIAVVLRSVDLGRTAEALSHTRLLWLAPCFVLVAVGIALRAMRWQRLLPTTDRTVPIRRITPILLIGYLGNTVLPARLGEPIRAYLLARREGLSSFEVFGTALLERILDVAVLAVMAFAASWAIGAVPWVVQLTGVAAGIGLLIVTLLTLVGIGPAIRIVDRLAGDLRLVAAGSILTRLDRFARGFGGRSQRLPVAEAAAVSIPIWLVDASICWLAAQSIGANLGAAAALLVVAVGALGTSIPSAPGYIGTYELAASAAARAVGLGAPEALSLAIVIHAITLLPVAVAGAGALLVLGSGSLLDLAGAATGRDESGPIEG